MITPSTIGALAGLRVLDLSRVLAGPWCAQVLGDLGADVIKVEQPGRGDDTRQWGPPFVPGTTDATYYTCANRNKRSIAIDIAQPGGADLVRQLAEKADVVIENFRVGGLARFGLDYAALSATNPGLVWCAITGFGQTGPESAKGGYDFLIQGMSGLMSVTGAPDGPPTKVGIPIADLGTGLYAAIAILAAIRHRDRTGEGQYIDLALFDTQLALMSNQAAAVLNGGPEPVRMGNAHPTITPYETLACADGDILIACGNDRQFARLCGVLGLPDMPADPRFATMAQRSANRGTLIAALVSRTAEWNTQTLADALQEAGVPAGRANTVPQAVAHPQTAARGVVRRIERGDGADIGFVGFPPQLEKTPAVYAKAPPQTGADGRSVLAGDLGLTDGEIAALIASGAVGAP